MRTYAALPSIPDAGILHRYADRLAVIVPVARVNLVPNPSVETGTDGYTGTSGASVARTTDQQYVGAYSLRVTPDATTSSGMDYQGLAALVVSTTYAISVFLRGAAGKAYRLSVITLGGQTLASTGVRASGRWERVTLIYTEASGAVRHIRVAKDGGTETTPFEIDGLQVEACGSEGVFATTYLDGDQRGLVPHEVPAAYLWDGVAHTSTSRRSAMTRAGGRVVRWRDAGFVLTQIVGLELAPPEHELLTFAHLDGGQYQDTILPPRTFTLVGRWVGTTPGTMDAASAALARLLVRDRVGRRQPLLLTLQSADCGSDAGALVTVPALYSGGLEGQTVDLPTAAAAVSFLQPQPAIYGHDGGAALDALAVVDVAYVVRRTPAGVWAAMDDGTDGAVTAFARNVNGSIYVGGTFTTVGGDASTGIATWSPATGVWAPAGSVLAGTGDVLAFAIAPSGEVAVGGTFLNAGGVIAADNLGRITVPLGIWGSYGASPPNDSVRALLWHTTTAGLTLYAGGNFTNIGGVGVQYVAAWNGSAWSELESTTALNGVVNALAATADGMIYVGGAFTTVNGAAQEGIGRYNPTTDTWTAMDGVDAPVYALAVAADGTVYAGGDFVTAGGISVNYIARWTGTRWEPLGSGTSSPVYALTIAPDGTLIAGGGFPTAGGMATPGGLARWNGAAWLPLDITMTSAVTTALLATPDGAIYVGNDFSATATAAGSATATNAGTAQAQARLVLRGPSSGAATVYRVANETTGAQVTFVGLAIAAGETQVLTLDPTNVTFVSDTQGTLLRTIAPGSQVTGFALQPGANTITLFASADTVTAALSWRTTYAGLADALDEVAL